MDHELLHIFEELKSKNWNKDLINYKRSLNKNPVIQTRVSSLVDFNIIRKFGLLGLISGGLFGYFLNLQWVTYLFIACSACASILLGSVLGLIGIILIPIFMGFFILFGMLLIPFLLQSVFLLKIIGVLIGAFTGSVLIGLISNVALHLLKKSDKQFDNVCRTEELTPRELLSFWDNRLKNYLYSHQFTVINKRAKAFEDYNFWSHRCNVKTESFEKIKIFQSKLDYSKNVIKQADQLLEIINQLERGFSERINSLRVVVKKRDEELNQILRKNQLDNRIDNIINQSESVSQQWLAERRMLISKTGEAQDSLLEYMADITDSISKATEHNDQNEG